MCASHRCGQGGMIKCVIFPYPNPSPPSLRPSSCLLGLACVLQFCLLSPVIDQWVPVLEQGLIGSGQPVAAVSERGEEERLHWSGLHVALQVRGGGAGTGAFQPPRSCERLPFRVTDSADLAFSLCRAGSPSTCNPYGLGSITCRL